MRHTPMLHLKTASVLGLATVAGLTANAWELDLGNNQKIDFHGFASQGFLASTDYDYLGKTTDGSFQFTELGLNASYSPFKRTRITVQGFAFDTGKVGNLEPFLDYASIEYTFSDYVGIRAGRVRKPGGIYNHIQDLDLARTAILLPQGLYDARWRDFSTSVDGGLLFGSIPLGKAGSLSYEAFAGLVNLSNDGGVAQWIADGGAQFQEFGQPVSVGGQLWWNTPVSGLRVGAYLGHMSNFTFDIVNPVGPGVNAYAHADATVLLQQYSIEYTWKQWTFQAEYFTYNYEGFNTVNVLAGGVPVAPTSVSPSQTEPDAWYVGAAYRFNSWLEAGTYYTEHYADKSVRSSGGPNGSQKDLAFSLRFDPKDWWIIKLEGHYIRGTSLLQDQANNPNALRTDDGWWLFAAKTTFSF